MSLLQLDNSLIGHLFANERFRDVVATVNGVESVGAGESRWKEPD
jgi:hypothetical protein